MLFLLDADTIITSERNSYNLEGFEPFWWWLVEKGENGDVKIPIEQFEEVTDGTGAIVDFLGQKEVEEALVLSEDADPEIVSRVVEQGYGDLDDREILKIGRDPFLISYGVIDPENRKIVTYENSAPSKVRANRKVPDVCRDFGIHSCTMFELVRELKFKM
ncbi:DUF4411 family protein [Marimonas lutisalis]|uniref:DUF4411 family protein n=1 Tax=Marimonas lutisalis TaxID=2545756 RepID=UPI00195FE60B|nr:DUF4411 family protein [Marimonas lutisalis]